MDIEIVRAYQDDRWIFIERIIDGRSTIERMPKETLAIRAAEYDLEVDDPRVLDQVLLEGFYTPEDPNETHPLFSAATVAEALAIMEQRIEQVRNDNGAPKDPQMRSLFKAADKAASSQGLTDAKALLLENADPEIGIWVKMQRDAGRELPSRQPASFKEVIKEMALGPVIDAARIEDNARTEVERHANDTTTRA